MNKLGGDNMLWSDLEKTGLTLEPWKEFERLSRELFNWPEESVEEFPSVNLWVADEGGIITTELPGVESKDIDISLVGKTLTIKGLRKEEDLGEDDTYLKKERWYGNFKKTVELPFNVESDKVSASFSNGILTIELPRAEAEKPKKIEIKST
jgi:HSP20 family protein